MRRRDYDRARLGKDRRGEYQDAGIDRGRTLTRAVEERRDCIRASLGHRHWKDS